MNEKWIDVVSDPLGLAGFALFLIFTFVTRHVSKSQKKQLAPFFMAAALIALVGGLFSYLSPYIGDQTSGDKSPIVKNISGTVTISDNITDQAD